MHVIVMMDLSDDDDVHMPPLDDSGDFIGLLPEDQCMHYLCFLALLVQCFHCTLSWSTVIVKNFKVRTGCQGADDFFGRD
jgi:hypothetical protein